MQKEGLEHNIDDDYSDILKGRRIVVFSAVIVGVLVVGFLFGFLVLRGGEDVDEVESEVGEGETKDFIEIYNDIIQEGDIGRCAELYEKFGSNSMVEDCKIKISATLGEDSYCVDVDASYFAEHKFVFSDKWVRLNNKEYCWIMMVEDNKVNYCDNLEREVAKEICLEAFAYYSK